MLFDLKVLLFEIIYKAVVQLLEALQDLFPVV